MSKKDIKKVVLAYSGGLDTSIILKWLQDEYDAEVITFTADLGQGEEVEPARAKAIACGIKPENVYILDVKEEFVKDYVFPMFRANAIYEGEYLLGTSIARPLIAKKLVEIANEKGAQAVSHGATGKGNDQVRFELGALALNPDLKVIAPWREWELNSRESLLEYAKKHGIEISQKHVDENGNPKISPYSMDANLLHISYEGLHLENPAAEPEESMWLWTTSPEKAPDCAEIIEIEYKNGDPIALNGEKLSPANLLLALNKLGNKHGIGRVDIVENRCVGMKARGCYETPGGRYGSIEPKSGKSYTQLEFEYAVEIKKPYFSVVITEKGLDEKVASHLKRNALEDKYQKELTEFKMQIMSSNVVREWDDKKDIKIAIHETLS